MSLTASVTYVRSRSSESSRNSLAAAAGSSFSATYMRISCSRITGSSGLAFSRSRSWAIFFSIRWRITRRLITVWTSFLRRLFVSVATASACRASAVADGKSPLSAATSAAAISASIRASPASARCDPLDATYCRCRIAATLRRQPRRFSGISSLSNSIAPTATAYPSGTVDVKTYAFSQSRLINAGRLTESFAAASNCFARSTSSSRAGVAVALRYISPNAVWKVTAASSTSSAEMLQISTAGITSNNANRNVMGFSPSTLAHMLPGRLSRSRQEHILLLFYLRVVQTQAISETPSTQAVREKMNLVTYCRKLLIYSDILCGQLPDVDFPAFLSLSGA